MRRAPLLVLTLVVAGCSSILGLDEVSESPPVGSDAAPPVEGGGDARPLPGVDAAAEDADTNAAADADAARSDASSDASTDGPTRDGATTDGATDPCPGTIVSWDFSGAAPPAFSLPAAVNGTTSIDATGGVGGSAAFRSNLNGGQAQGVVQIDFAKIPVHSACTGAVSCRFDVRYVAGSTFGFVTAFSTSAGAQDYATLSRYSGDAWLATFSASYVGPIASPFSLNKWTTFTMELRTSAGGASVRATGPQATLTRAMDATAGHMNIGGDKAGADPAVDLYVDNLVCRRLP